MMQSMSLLFLLCFGEELELKLGYKQTDSNQKIPIWIEIRTSNLSNQVPNSTQHQKDYDTKSISIIHDIFWDKFCKKFNLKKQRGIFCQRFPVFWEKKFLSNFEEIFPFQGKFC